MKYTNIQNVVIYKNIVTFLNEDSYAHQGCIYFKYLFYYYFIIIIIMFNVISSEFPVALTLVFSVTWPFRNDFNILIWSFFP